MGKKIKSILFDNFHFKLLALMIAFLMWFIVMNMEDSIVSKTISDIPVEMINGESILENGNLYNVIGFNRKGLSQSYWYVHRGTYKRYHRSSFTKRKLREKGFDTTNQTEKEIMSQKLPYYCIYDSGTTKWELTIQYPSKF